MIQKYFFILFFAITQLFHAQHSILNYPITAIDIRNVVINDNFWLPKIKLIQDTTIKFAFDKCKAEGRMDNFLIAGGRLEGTTKGKMPFDDTDLYKIIEGASYSLISTPNKNLDAYLDSIISIIEIGQEKDGYITTWFTIDRMKPPAWWANPSPNRWEFEVTNHELYNSGHLFEAAAAHYWATGKRNFLDIAIKNADLLVNNFGPNKLRIPPGHQIVETGLIKLYQITKNKSYLNLSKFFLDLRGDSTSHKLYGEYSQDHLPVVDQSEAVGHAVRAVYMYAAMTDIAAIYGDKSYLHAVNKIWENIVNKKMYITGGIGSRHDGEAFGDNYELPNLTGYNETCAAIGNVHWNQRLFQLTGNSRYYDVIERSLYNGLLSGISADGINFFYPNPLESDGSYKFNQGACTRQSWFDCSCCPTNMIRFLPSIPGLIYSTYNDSLYINLFISNKSSFKINDHEIKLVQTTNYPWDGKVNFKIKSSSDSKFTVKIRIPSWVNGEVLPGDLYNYINDTPNKITLKVNGHESTFDVDKGYAIITRNWKDEDNIELMIPMNIRKVTAHEKVVDNLNKVAFEYGPIVYCAEQVDNNNIDNLLFDTDALTNLGDKFLLTENIKVINGQAAQNDFTLIPYYLWSNRGIGKMKVWLPIKG